MKRSEIILCKMKNRVVVITVHKTEVLTASNQTMVVDTLFHIDSDTQSGLVFLRLGVLGNCDLSDENAWNNKLNKKRKGCKQNILGTGKSQYFNLNGEYYSYRNSSAYWIINNLSVDIYANKSSKSVQTQQVINRNASDIELLLAKEIRTAFRSLKKIIRNVPLLISPVFDAAYKLQNIMGGVNLSQVKTSNCGAWKFHICVNASTSIFHTESDCIYTLISVPLQKLKPSEKSKMDSMLIFQLNSSKSITLPLHGGLSFLYSGLFLTHRQH